MIKLRSPSRRDCSQDRNEMPYNSCQRYTGGVQYYDSGCGPPYDRQCCKQTFIALLVVIAVMIVFGAIPPGATFGGIAAATANSRSRSFITVPVYFSPGDTRIMSFSSFFCSELTLEDRSNRTGATLYLITDTPPLTDKNSFTIGSDLSIGTYQYWNYYLYPGSNFTTSLFLYRVPDSSTGAFYLMKGRSNFQQWINDRTNNSLAFFSIPCTARYTHQFSFQVQDEDEYYFVFQRRTGRGCSTSNNAAFLNFRLHVSLSVSRFLYSASGLTRAPNCSTIDGQCSLNVPADSNYRALIVTDIPNNPDWEENVDISLHCSSNRAWAYVVVVPVPSLIIISVCITVVILLGCVCWRKRDSLRTCCSRSPQTTAEPDPPTSTVQLQRTEHSTEQQPTDHKSARPGDIANGNGQQQQQQHLTAVPPPSYKASLDYPKKADLPPPYSE